MMIRKSLLFIIVIALIISSLGAWDRYLVEKNNDGIELVMDDDIVNQLSRNIDVDKQEILKQFKEKGLTGVAIYQDRLQNLVKESKARILMGNEIKRSEEITGRINPDISGFPYTESSAFLVTTEKDLIERAAEVIPGWVGSIEDNQVDYNLNGDKLIVFFKEWDSKYLDLTFGFSADRIREITETGLEVIPRLRNGVIGYSEWNILDKLKPEMIIFEGNEVSGYPDDIAQTASMMLKNGIYFGMIEKFIATQKGADELARRLNYNLVRVHSIQQQEMDTYAPEKIIDRYLRAVRERDVRILYLKPFMKKRGEEGLTQSNLTFIDNLKHELEKGGYVIGNAQPYPDFSNSLLFVVITALGIIAGGIILLEYLLGISLRFWGLLILITGLLAVTGLILKGYGNLTREILALGSSVIFPSLAIISQFLAGDNDEFWGRKFLKTVLISLAGALLLVSSLASLTFVLKVEQFRGVKLAFILPLLLISIYYFWPGILKPVKGKGNQDKKRALFERDLFESVYNFLEMNIKVKHVLLVFILLTGGIVYVGRTGNFPLLPVPPWEIKLRDILEQYLFVRPRFKEFLFGHPFLVLGFMFRGKFMNNLYFYPLLLLGSIGQITILNTFSHIHTPLLISIIRVFNGLWLGILIGLVLFLMVKLFIRFKEKIYG